MGTSNEQAETPPYRYHSWRDTVIRERAIHDVEALTGRGWSYTPYALDALTGMGEDPYSCGEWCDPITEAEARRIAAKKGLSLEAPGIPRWPEQETAREVRPSEDV